MAGRPKSFDPDAALQQAMVVFWRQGYQATAVEDLLLAMGINRASLYDTFGSKRDLFLQAVRRYAACEIHQLGAILDDAASAGVPPLQRLERMFQGFEAMLFESDSSCCPGCLMTNTIIEMAQADAEIAAVVREESLKLASSLEATLQEAKDTGLVPAIASTEQLVAYLMAVLQGIVVSAKSGTERQTIRSIGLCALSAIRAGGHP